MAIAKGLMSEDDYLLTEILFNPNSSEQLGGIIAKLTELKDIVEKKDSTRMKTFIDVVRANIK